MVGIVGWGIGALALLQSAGYGISTAVLVWAFLRCDRTLRVRDLFAGRLRSG